MSTLPCSRVTRLRIEVCLFDAQSNVEVARYDLPGRTGDIWHGLVSPRICGPGTHYAFYVHGPNDPRTRTPIRRIHPPYRSLCARIILRFRLRARVVDRRFDWGNDRHPRTPWRDSVIYELHVKGFTQLHPAVAQACRGKYLGLAVPPVIEHLKSIGVTAVELLPCQSFKSEPFLQQRNLANYWGYNPLAYFAPANEYAIDDAVVEFKTAVKALHAAGIEVILDVVFNHTCEGNEHGPTLSLKGIDNSIYYRLQPDDPRFYDNASGCGNTLNCDHPQVRAMIVDCMKYWVEDMHIDGFRFDLATVLARGANGFDEHSAFFKAVRAEPALAHTKLIAEPWDCGWGGYQLGRFPAGWAEWNDRYRDTLRSFVRGDGGKLGEFAERFAGSSDIFRHNGRKPTASASTSSRPTTASPSTIWCPTTSGTTPRMAKTTQTATAIT